MTLATSAGARRHVRAIGGYSAILGGLLFVLASLNQSFIGLDRTQSTLLASVAGLLLACGEVALVRDFGRAHPGVAAAVSALLALAAVLTAIGLYSLLSAGAIVGIVFAAFGILPWVLAAPIVAVGNARHGLLSRPPAIALATMTTLIFVATAARIDSVVIISFVAYGLAWTWVGLALLDGAMRRARSIGKP